MGLYISSDFVLGEGELALDHPRILWDDISRHAGTTIVSSSEQVGFELENAFDYLTWDFWRPSSIPATITITTAVAEDVDYALIAAHNLGTTDKTVTLEYYNGSAWVAIDDANPANDRVIVFLFDNVFSNQFRLTVSGDATVPSIGVFMIGKALAVQRKLYKGHTPITLSKRTVKQPNRSEGGHWLGTSIRREGAATTIAFGNLKSDWIRQKFEPFIEAARSYPFGWVWRPDEFPAEVAYVFAPDDIRVINSGPRDFMSTSFAVEGILD